MKRFLVASLCAGALVLPLTYLPANSVDAVTKEAGTISVSYSTEKEVAPDTVEFSIADLISGLQSEITSSNKLSADLVEDGTNNKVFTATEKTKLSGIEAGAEVNVQSDWNQTNTSADDYVKNKPTIPNVGTLNTNNSTAQTVSSSESFSGSINLHKVSKTGSYNDLNDKPTIPTVPTNISSFTNDVGYITSTAITNLTDIL
jgi:hypothetical protein